MTQQPARSGSMWSRIRRLIFRLYIVCLLGVNGVLLLPNVSFPDSEGSNSAFSLSWVLMHLAAIAVLLSSRRQSADLVSAPIIFGIFATASSIWSSDAGASLLYGAMLTGNILVARQMAREMSPKEILELLATTIIVICGVGIALYYVGMQEVVWYDTRGRTNLLGGELLRGLFPHRIAGATYAIIGATAAYTTMSGIRRAISLILVVWFLILTASATGYVLAVVAVALLLFTLGALRRRTTFQTFLLTRVTVGALLAIALWLLWDWLLGVLGRDPTLTARTFLWEWGFQAWQVKPIIGWGYNAYFESDHAITTHASIREVMYYDVPHFHQSFIQTAVDLGLLGLLLLVIVVGKAVAGSYRLGAVAGHERLGATFFTITGILLVAAFVGYVFAEYNHFGTFMLFSVFYIVRYHAPTHVEGGRIKSALSPSAL